MAKSFSFFGAVVLLAVLAVGCAGPEKKLGRGVNNIYEPVRLAEMRRSVEQTSFAMPGEMNYHTGVVRGFNRTVARAGVGIYEIITFPFPPYDPVFTDYLAPTPQYPDSYKPGLLEDSMFATDTSIGFSGGDVAPFVPGSRFRIFDN
jgi:putative exosortase-associated protein (TIGR04073 family)